MARRVKDRNLDSRDARRKLKASGRPYWRAIGKGLHIGYRKGKTGGVWVVRRYLGGQTYKLETVAEADDILDADGSDVLDFWQAQEVARHLRQAPRRGTYEVKDAISDYLNHLEGRASYHDSKKRFEAFVLPVFGSKKINELAADDIRNWHRAIAKTPARARTRKGAEQAYRAGNLDEPETQRKRQSSANRCLSLLKAALNYAWREKKVDTNDAWQRVELFRGVDIDIPRARYLSVVESQRLINASLGDFRILVQAALQTGARYQELARLRVSDFNTAVGTLHIRKTKTHKDRHVILTDEGREFFGQLAAGQPGSALLLGKEWKPSHQAPLILKACKQASIEPPLNFHALRHTWASLSVMGGMPLMVVAKNLGHADTRMVERHYGHLAPSYVADSVRKHAPRFGTTPSNVRAL